MSRLARIVRVPRLTRLPGLSRLPRLAELPRLGKLSRVPHLAHLAHLSLWTAGLTKASWPTGLTRLARLFVGGGTINRLCRGRLQGRKLYFLTVPIGG